MKNRLNSYFAIGLMSGTSLDGLDISYTKFTETMGNWSFSLLSFKSIPYPQELKNKLREAVDLPSIELLKFDIELGRYFAEEVYKFIKEKNITRIDVIGSHGHTVFHQPENDFTLQIGNPLFIHKRIKKTVIADFRSQDVALGGQGAPLVPIGDKLLFSNYNYRINLGGFANISFEKNEKTIAYDICAVNTILNKYANKLGYDYDDKGEISRNGSLIPYLFKELENLKFYSQKPPKSLGVEWNQEILFPVLEEYSGNKTEDVMHTYTQHIASQIGNVITGKNKKVLISGGGAFNDYLISLIKKTSNNEIIIESKDITDFKEAIIFSFLAVLRIRGEVNCLSEVTGAKIDHSTGVIYDFYTNN